MYSFVKYNDSYKKSKDVNFTIGFVDLITNTTIDNYTDFALNVSAIVS
jgi:hypothetical protein